MGEAQSATARRHLAGMSRVRVVALALSAAGLVGLAASEWFTQDAKIPVPGDVPTYGFGSTTRPDGSPVKMGDTITPPAALNLALRDVRKFEGALKRCIKVPMHQHEYDAAIQLAYNIGETAFCNSTVARKFNAGDYTGACDAFLMWVKVAGRIVQGLVNRRERERQLCLGLA